MADVKYTVWHIRYYQVGGSISDVYIAVATPELAIEWARKRSHYGIEVISLERSDDVWVKDEPRT